MAGITAKDAALTDYAKRLEQETRAMAYGRSRLAPQRIRALVRPSIYSVVPAALRALAHPSEDRARRVAVGTAAGAAQSHLG